MIYFLLLCFLMPNNGNATFLSISNSKDSKLKEIKNESHIFFDNNIFFRHQDYLVARFPVTKNLHKYKSSIEDFIKELKIKPNFDGSIVFYSSRRLSEKQTQIYAKKLKNYVINLGINANRLKIINSGKAERARFDLYASPSERELNCADHKDRFNFCQYKL